jgi:hypothetical protein
MPKKPKNLFLRYGLDVLVMLAMGGLLYIGASWQIFQVYTDAARYECYIVAFWHGMPALKTFPEQQCDFLVHPDISFISQATIVKMMHLYKFPAQLILFVAHQSPNQPLHALPHEYPLPTVIPFTLGLIAPHYWYQVAFAVWMSLVAAIIYMLLLRFRSRGAAIVCALYLVIGGWATVDGRFDLVPSLLTLAAGICGVQKRWNWAFAFLALATTFKFYPLVLILPFLIAQQMESRDRWYAWRRFAPLGVFAAVCMLVVALSLFLSVEGTLGPLSYFKNRPFQIESAAGSVLWLFSRLGYQLHVVYNYGSLNVISPLAPQVSLVDTLLLGVGLLYTWWLQWRGKTDLITSCLLTLLIVMLTGKVFSPQYLIWIIPLAAYVGEKDLKWVVAWCMLGALTTFIYPYIYTMSTSVMDVPAIPLFYPVVAARNLLFFCIIASLLIYCSRKQIYTAHNTFSLQGREAESSK